ncbi:MAG: prolipoprotein diacylglyceryl transferase [Rickettsiaceae bacterium]|nr:prolipoprotein diacylglyceryl transferase [Rickettsiaceae bacterium]
MKHLTFPNIDPVILKIPFLPLAISFYSLAYVAGILLGIFYASKMAKKYGTEISNKQWEDFITYSVFGIILGGRIGYVLIYDSVKYLTHPIEILKIYMGGMSFHGGLIGMILAIYLFARNNKIQFLKILDLAAMGTPIGLFLGRIANFINAELYGRVTDLPIAFVFPGSDGMPRHPSQLYEAVLEGICLFIIMFLSRNNLKKPGFNSGIFIVFYGIFRIFAEYFREPDVQIGFLFNSVTMGQILSVPMILAGMALIWKAKTQQKN